MSVQVRMRSTSEKDRAHHTCRTIATLAVEALMDEASLEGKPGLVCPSWNGAHRDMTYAHFLTSAAALGASFMEIAQTAWDFEGKQLATLLPLLRPAGIAAEQTMYRVTRGVNTHKGAIFTLGLCVAAAAWLLGHPDAGHAAPIQQDTQPYAPLSDWSLCQTIRAIAADIVRRDMEQAAPDTHGKYWFAKAEVRGVRGQAEDGFPLVFDLLLPLFRTGNPASPPTEAQQMQALLTSIAVLEDTCLLARGGMEGLAWAQARAAAQLEAGIYSPSRDFTSLAGMNEEFCSRNLSPGGSADMLAAALFIHALQRQSGGNLWP